MIIVELAMRFNSPRKITTFHDNKGFHGVEYVNRATPTGEDRWLSTFADSRGYSSDREAIARFKESLQFADERMVELFGPEDTGGD
jgi:hypothetical protein